MGWAAWCASRPAPTRHGASPHSDAGAVHAVGRGPHLDLGAPGRRFARPAAYARPAPLAALSARPGRRLPPHGALAPAQAGPCQGGDRAPGDGPVQKGAVAGALLLASLAAWDCAPSMPVCARGRRTAAVRDAPEAAAAHPGGAGWGWAAPVADLGRGAGQRRRLCWPTAACTPAAASRTPAPNATPSALTSPSCRRTATCRHAAPVAGRVWRRPAIRPSPMRKHGYSAGKRRLNPVHPLSMWSSNANAAAYSPPLRPGAQTTGGLICCLFSAVAPRQLRLAVKTTGRRRAVR
jgi:hypothetical protein